MLLDSAKKKREEAAMYKVVPRQWRQRVILQVKSYYVTAAYRLGIWSQSRGNKKLSGCIRDRNQESLERNEVIITPSS